MDMEIVLQDKVMLTTDRVFGPFYFYLGRCFLTTASSAQPLSPTSYNHLFRLASESVARRILEDAGYQYVG